MSKTFADSTYSGGSSSSVSIFALPALRSRFSWARAERISFARCRARIRWSRDLSGTAADVCRRRRGPSAAASISARRPRRKGDHRRFRRNSVRPQVEVDASGRSGSRSRPLDRRAPRRARARIRSAASGSRKLAVPTATARRAGGQERERVGPRLDPAHADHRDRDRGRDPAHLVERDRPDRRAREPAAAGSEPGLERVRGRAPSPSAC